MIHGYKVTQQGEYHKKHNLVCQDFGSFNIVSDKVAIAAVADGLGSELYTDVAAQLAVECVLKYCEEHLSDETDYKDVISHAFREAWKTVVQQASSDGNDIGEYDTTLVTVIFKDGTVYYGNSGDSGIVVLNMDGKYHPLTEQQRDENGCVFPLCFEDKWVFGEEKDVSSVLLATDGMYETLFPYLLKGEPEEIYVALAQFMMDGRSLGYGEKSDDQIQEMMDDFVANLDKQQVTDDKTILLLYDDSVELDRQPDEYYAVPDWDVLKQKHDEEFKKQAYPHMYK